MTERWSEISGFSCYRISSKGNVWTKKRNRLLIPHIVLRKKHKTVTVMLKSDDTRWVVRKIGHLVLEAFVGPRTDGQVMRHLDGDGTFNVPENLAWGTQAENIADAVRHGTAPRARGERNKKAKLDTDKVLEIRRRLGDGEGRRCLAREFGVTKSSIGFIAQRRSWAHI
jgi:hypothetical protein